MQTPMSPAAPHLNLEQVSLAYRDESGQQHQVIHQVSLSMQKGQVACLLGPSGCGKTSILRAIAGFEPISAGSIKIDGVCVSSDSIFIPPEKRRIGVVFQDYALFPHLNVHDNIAFGLRLLTKEERLSRVSELLNLVGLTALSQKHPHELSGGQQQRVALARALAPKPALLLFDEPFSSLDVDLRQRLATEIGDILRQAQATALFVTHDQLEAFALADEIGVMNQGKIIQWDTAQTLYHAPKNVFVADFIGHGAILDCNTVPEFAHHGNQKILVRPEALKVDPEGSILAHIKSMTFLGADYLYTVQTDLGTELTVRHTSPLLAKNHAALRLKLNPTLVTLIPNS